MIMIGGVHYQYISLISLPSPIHAHNCTLHTPLSHVEPLTPRMYLRCLLLLLIPDVALSQEHNESTVQNTVESYNKEREGNIQDKVLFTDSPHSNDHPTQAYLHARRNWRHEANHNNCD